MRLLLILRKSDNLPEWLTGWPAKPLLSERESSNLSVVDLFINVISNLFFCSFFLFFLNEYVVPLLDIFLCHPLFITYKRGSTCNENNREL